MRLDEKHLGRLTLNCKSEILAGEMSTFEFTFTAGAYGIDDTGSIRLAWRNPSDWGVPQFEKPKGNGYTTVTTNAKATLAVDYDYFMRPYNQSIVIKVSDGFLQEGDTITIIMGDTSKGSPGIKTQTFMESKHEFRLFIDPFGTKRYMLAPYIPIVKIVPNVANEMHVILPSKVCKGEEFDIIIRVIDEYGNPSYVFEDAVRLSTFGAAAGLEFINEINFTTHDKGVKRVKARSVENGVYYIKGESSELESISNGMNVEDVHEYKLYWADMHGQTDLTVGTGSMDEYFAFARDVACVDVTGWQGNDFQIDDQKWNLVREKTKAYYKPHEFVTFLGYEWSGNTPGGGDHNIYFKDDNEHFYPSSNWLDWEASTSVGDNAFPISELWEKAKGREDFMAIPHVGGRYGNFDYYNEEFIPCIEIHSHHGTFEWYIEEAMKRRMKVGFVGSSDDHTCRPGMSYPLSKDGRASSFDVASGYTAIYSKELTRDGIWEALKERRCYATTFNRLALDVRVDGHFMGEEISISHKPKIDISILGHVPIDNIKIFNWENKIADIDLQDKAKKKIKISWSGVRVRTRKKSTRWDGSIFIENGYIEKVDEYAFDRLDQGVKLATKQRIDWISNTSGDRDGLIVEINGDEDTIINFVSEQKSVKVALQDIINEKQIFNAGGENLLVTMELANEEIISEEMYLEKCIPKITFVDESIKNGLNAYWVRVLQDDGHMAWSSPIFIDYQDN